MELSWIDSFLVIDFILVIFLVFLDWLIGKDQRFKLKEKVGDWYIFLSDSSYGKLIESDVRIFRKYLISVFGEKLFSKKRILVTFIASGIFTLFSFISILFLFPNLGDKKDYAASVLSSVIPNMFGDWMSVSISIWLLGWMHKGSIFYRYALIIVLDILAVFTILIFVLSIAVLSLSMFPLSSVNIPYAGEGIGFSSAIITFLIVLLTAVLPTVLHILYAIYLLFSKLTGAMLRGPVSLLALRFYECEKGILTQISISLGVLAKITQEVVKYFNYVT